MFHRSPRIPALLAMVLAAAVWATSFVGVRYVLEEVGPFTLAGLRYSLAFVLLLPWLWRRRDNLEIRSKAMLKKLALIGVSQYAVGNGALFWALKSLPATAGALGLCLVPIPVLVFGFFHLRERPQLLQVVGLAVAIGGSVVFFGPGLGLGGPGALAALGVALVAFSVLPVWGRELAREGQVGNVVLTSLPLAIGGALALVAGLAWEGWPHLSLPGWGIVWGLAVVNTALAYLLFNYALRQLTALEASLILNLSPVGTALLARATLGEALSATQVGAVFAVVVGVSLAQWRRR